MSTWGRKVGQKWDQLKRSDSSEILSSSEKHNLPVNCQNTSATSLSSLSEEAELCSKNMKRISRVESLRNLFQRNEKACCSSDSQKKCDIVNNNATECKNDRIKHDRFYQLCNLIKDHELSGKLKTIAMNKQLNDSDSKKCIEEILNNFEELESEETPEKPTEKPTLYTKHSKTINAMRNIFTLKSAKSFENTLSRKDKSRQIRSISSGNMSNLFTNSKKTLSLEEIRCVLSNILIKSDESGYGSDSTRTSSESPCGSIKSQATEPGVQCTTTNTELDRTLTNTPVLPDTEMEVIVHEKRDCSTFIPTFDDDTDSADEEIFLETRKKQRKTKTQIRRTPSSHIKMKNLRNDPSFLRKRNINSFMKKNDMKRAEPVNVEEFFTNFSPTSTLKTRPVPQLDTCEGTTTPILSKQPIFDKEYKCMHLTLEDNEDTGLIISKRDENHANSPYVIVNVIPGMPADRYVYFITLCWRYNKSKFTMSQNRPENISALLVNSTNCIIKIFLKHFLYRNDNFKLPLKNFF